MKKETKRIEKKRLTLLISFFILCLVFFVWAFLSFPTLRLPLEEGWRVLTKEARKMLGLKKRDEVPPEEKRIREEVILKKMDEANAQQDWRFLAPEYPKPKKVEADTDEERVKVIRNSQEFQELEKEFKDYLKKREEQLIPEPPIPSMKEASKMPKLKDRGEEKIIEKLLVVKESSSLEKALDENLQLGIKGPLVTRKILERPPPPQVKVKVEAEIEMTVWVLPNGMVDRVIPALKGDAELERIASQYLKQWRFAPLPRDQSQSEQWGTIPIKFKLQ
ncbi:MAG: energy transducer TonB [Deltaproteobacteria bacterium]|nr:energy transducer TonB [Deltaproteobacteria bacterium]MBM4323148.1 energy transducer TonB [Deltaproteobacteria bacterium]